MKSKILDMGINSTHLGTIQAHAIADYLPLRTLLWLISLRHCSSLLSLRYSQSSSPSPLESYRRFRFLFLSQSRVGEFMFIVCCDGNEFLYSLFVARAHESNRNDSQITSTYSLTLSNQEWTRNCERARERIYLQLRLSLGQCGNVWSESRTLAFHHDGWLGRG